MREPSELGALLVDARRRLRPLRALTENPLLPATLRDPLRDALREMLTSAQDSLERSVRRQPQNAERLLAVVRENGLLAALSTPRLPPAPGPAQPPGSAPNSPPVGRRVIL
jgi:hypothetical protein